MQGDDSVSEGEDVVVAGNGDESQPLVKKRDTHKIKTNPKYRCVDEGSDDGGDDDAKQEDYGQLSSKEIDFRETIIKQESKEFFF